MKEPIEPKAKSTSLTRTTFHNGKITSQDSNIVYYKDYSPNGYHRLPSACHCDEIEKEFDEYHHYLKDMKKWNKLLQDRINREMGVEL